MPTSLTQIFILICFAWQESFTVSIRALGETSNNIFEHLKELRCSIINSQNDTYNHFKNRNEHYFEYLITIHDSSERTYIVHHHPYERKKRHLDRIIEDHHKNHLTENSSELKENEYVILYKRDIKKLGVYLTSIPGSAILSYLNTTMDNGYVILFPKEKSYEAFRAYKPDSTRLSFCQSDYSTEEITKLKEELDNYRTNQKTNVSPVQGQTPELEPQPELETESATVLGAEHETESELDPNNWAEIRFPTPQSTPLKILQEDCYTLEALDGNTSHFKIWTRHDNCTQLSLTNNYYFITTSGERTPFELQNELTFQERTTLRAIQVDRSIFNDIYENAMIIRADVNNFTAPNNRIRRRILNLNHDNIIALTTNISGYYNNIIENRRHPLLGFVRNVHRNEIDAWNNYHNRIHFIINLLRFASEAEVTILHQRASQRHRVYTISLLDKLIRLNQLNARITLEESSHVGHKIEFQIDIRYFN